MKPYSLGDVLMEWTRRTFGQRLIDTGKPANFHKERIEHATGLLLREMRQIGCCDVDGVLARYGVCFPDGYYYALAYPNDFPEHLQLTAERVRECPHNEK